MSEYNKVKQVLPFNSLHLGILISIACCPSVATVVQPLEAHHLPTLVAPASERLE
ncbi:uncharacterized protein PHACADRAFT_250463 [Phanerochaete carnosa HHB-10118-sp]|uniref:Uncharacterized protein n=1 Tax=Phanerochaete carnosa (strain HHB-10118-sp) TaxID=650164 RepID=K5XA10_PHACS|nr:uncharacterized protein PHACADRAFT_250463 [Phanerochaete carnosa HHB-10118-sp]EKM59757.1 hypothetical protein PHACADRAFT_250463 [Phanerochaete carnosa HHB-10118-sp]